MAAKSQSEFWNGVPGDVWVQSQLMLDEMLAPMTGPTMDALQIGAGAKVLDVGCGSGETTMMLEQRGFSALGVDISEPLIELARKRAAASGSKALFVLGDAGTVPAIDKYDALFSRFGVMFFEDPVAAFKNLHAQMKPGARLAFVCWRSGAENSWNLLPMQVIAPLLAEPLPSPDPTAPGPAAFENPERTRGILERAGWRDISFAPWDGELKIGPDVKATATYMLDMTASRLPPSVSVDMVEARRRVEEALAPLTRADGVYAMGACWIVTGVA